MNNEEYRKEDSKRMKNDKYMDILAGYISSIFQDLESYIRTEVDLVQDDIRLVLDEYNSSFLTYENLPGFYTFKDLSEILSKNLRSKFEGINNTVDFEFDAFRMKTKLVVRPGIIARTFDEKSFFNCFLGFKPH